MFMVVKARTEFALALNQVCNERGIEPEVVLESIATAVLSAYRKELATTTEEIINLEDFEAKVDPETGETKIFDKEGSEVTPAGFGRIAAQTAKQVILQKIREAEKVAVIGEFQSRVGTVVSGMVLRFEGQNIIVDIGRAQGVMPPSEQIFSERYRLNQRLTFYLKEIRETKGGHQVIVSRTEPGLVKGLFAREVPEVASEAVEIKGVAREAGSRTKIAVYSDQTGVDPVGSCVGQKGVRVTAVINELGGYEKIDIIQWYEEPEKFIASALQPAADLEVEVEEATKTATVMVADEQLSLAIGKEGQNARLAAWLTGYRIDIKGRSEVAKKALGIEEKRRGLKEIREESLEGLGISKRYVTALERAGVTRLESLRALMKKGKKLGIKGVGEKGEEEIKKTLGISG